MGLAMAKCRQVHSNTTKISLRIKEEVAKTPVTAAHGEVIHQLKGVTTKIDELCSQYEKQQFWDASPISMNRLHRAYSAKTSWRKTGLKVNSLHKLKTKILTNEHFEDFEFGNVVSPSETRKFEIVF